MISLARMILVWLLVFVNPCRSFRPQSWNNRLSLSQLHAKKKSPTTTTTTGKGFGQVEQQTPPKKTKPAAATDSPSSMKYQEPEYLQSVSPEEAKKIVVDTSLTPTQRTEKILRENYGMKTYEEQQMNAKQLAAFQEEQKRLQKLKKQVEMENVDIMTLLPGPLIIGIDRFLKAGLVVTGTLFILAGIGITLEAWSKTSGTTLPESLDTFIVQIIEPNFTYGLFVLLGFSVSLGFFAAMQLGSQGATYRED
jgi:hypothetical protein